MTRGWLLPLLALGCSTRSIPDRFLAVDGRQGEYALTEVEIPELIDPYRMEGTLGSGTVGGYFVFDDETDRLQYVAGGPMAVSYQVIDGVGVPSDDDGLSLWSYYHSLSAARKGLIAHGYDADALFPIDFAYQTSLFGSQLVSDNAAYVGAGANHFALLADPFNARLPLAANPLVIRHELGHAVFNDILNGDPRAWQEDQLTDERISAVNEGFADMLATLLLDDPDVLGASLGGALALDRRVDGDATTADALPLTEDFYSRGTVYASFAWDVRLVIGPDAALERVLEALRAFAVTRPFEDSTDDAALDVFGTLLLEAVLDSDPSLAPSLCPAHAMRFPDLPEPSACG